VEAAYVDLRPWRLLVAAGLVAATSAALAPAAHASCAGPPAESVRAFVGTVIDTREEDRIATVITDDGSRVTVLGTIDTGWFSESFASTDRRYVLGGRYEFHPVSATDPYRDNVCTATHKIAGPGLQPLEPNQEFLPGWVPIDEQAGTVAYVMFFGPVVAGALGLALLGKWAWRRRNNTTA
jgi:hypothetical protein